MSIDRLRPSLAWLLPTLTGGRLQWLGTPLDPEPRYGHGKPVHEGLRELIEAGRPAYRERLTAALDLRDLLTALPMDAPAGEFQPYWMNGWFPGLDVVTLYAILAAERPRRYVEVGSGHSTHFARRAARDLDLPLHISSIDPHPRVAVDGICDRTIRRRLEHVDLALFDELRPGDVLFVDSSHRTYMNSDVVTVFLDVLPRLSPGVLIHFHDVWLPADYPVRWRHWWFSEQYLLATLLLGAPERYEILLPNRFITDDPELSAILDPLWADDRLGSVPRNGGSFWMRQSVGRA